MSFILSIQCSKKDLICQTKIILIIIASLHRISVALASTPAEKEIGAFPALGIQLAGALYKASLLTPLIHLFHGIFIKVPQTIFIQHIKITGVGASVRFYHILNPALASLVAGLR